MNGVVIPTYNVVTKTASGTTDSQALLALGVTATGGTVLAVEDKTGRHIFMPFVFDDAWYAKVYNYSGTAQPSASISNANVTYIQH